LNLHPLPREIGAYVTLRGADVRFRGVLEALGFWPVRVEGPGPQTAIVMRRITGPLRPILRIVR
jgi:hypothetical protein